MHFFILHTANNRWAITTLDQREADVVTLLYFLYILQLQEILSMRHIQRNIWYVNRRVGLDSLPLEQESRKNLATPRASRSQATSKITRDLSFSHTSLFLVFTCPLSSFRSLVTPFPPFSFPSLRGPLL